MDKNDNVLLITYHPLTNINGGTVMYKNLIENFPSKNLHWIGTGAFLQKAPDFIYNSTKYHRIIRSYIYSKYWIRIFSKFPFNIFNTLLIYFFYTPRAVLIILYTIKKNKINYIWFETFRQTYLMAFILIKLLNLKVHLSFNDHYSAHCKWPESNFLKLLCKKLLASNSSFDFISKGMLEYFKSNYNFSSNRYLLLWTGNSNIRNSKATINKEVSKIIFYGSIHGLDVFYSFCEFISSQGNSEKKITLDIYSEFDYSFISNKYSNVNYLGKVSQEELSKIILKYDLVYVPIYFELRNNIVAKTSLSSKMLLAINCGVPIFSHGPDYSANTIFLKEHNLGITCPSLDLKVINEKINFIKKFENRIKIQESSIKFWKNQKSNFENAKQLYELIIS